MKNWRPLKKGDIVDVIAPASGPSAPGAIENARSFLISWGLVPRIPPGMIAPHFLHANDDDSRFELLKNALSAEDSAAVWCLRGGYGSNRLLPYLAKIKKPKKNKLFIGLSDITSLHIFLQQEWGWATFHGPILERLGRKAISPNNLAELKRLLFGQQDSIEYKNLKPMNDLARSTRKIKAPITGGNLMTLQSSIGTPFEIDLRGKILFIEEIAERGYRVDRILEHLEQSKRFAGCKGVIIGDFIGGNEPDGRNLVKPVLKIWADGLNIPVFGGVPAGHGEVQRPIPFGTMAEISGEQMKIPSGAV